MKIFKRERTETDILEDRYLNSFYKTGFVNDELLDSSDKDFWQAYMRMMSDTNASGIFDTILIGYQELPYSESVLSKAVLRAYKEEHLYSKDSKTFASVSIMPFKIYRLLLIHSPMSVNESNKGVEIMNTLRAIDEDYRYTFKIFDHVYRFLQNQAKLHTYNMEDCDRRGDLFIDGATVTVLVPELIDGSFYTINGVNRYPCISEKYHISRSQLGESELSFKARYAKGGGIKGADGRTRIKRRDAYFDIGSYYDEKENKIFDIFYIKFYTKWFINPFFMFDKEEMTEMMEEVRKANFDDKTREALENSYYLFMRDIEEVRATSKNSAPSIKIFKMDDSYYEEERAEAMDKLLANNIVDDDVENNVEHTNEADIQEETDKSFKASRHIISVDTLKSLILGRSQDLKLGYYSRLTDQLLKVTGASTSFGKKNEGVPSKNAPRVLQIIKTISSNADLFVSDSSTNPLDIFLKLNYRKFIHERARKGPEQRTSVPIRDRFLDFNTTYGLIDPTTTKSETSSGLVGNVSILKNYAKNFEYSTEKEGK